MFDENRLKPGVCTLAAILLMISASAWAQSKPTELEFGQPDDLDWGAFRTLQSVRKVKGAKGLYLMTHWGDRQDLYRAENQKLIDDPFINDRSRHCSLFSVSGGNKVWMGRNWDNENVGSIIVSLSRPPGRYSSISFSRAVEMGFGRSVDLEQIKSLQLGRRLLLAPFYAMDGINEHGLAVGVAGLKQTKVKPKSGKESVFISFIVRRMLDRAKTVEEAVELTERLVPFDLDQHSLNSHLLVVDSSGRSVILEYVQDRWVKIYRQKSWQVLANKPIYNMSESDLRKQCRRYRSMSRSLENKKGRVDWGGGLKILRDVAQKGTTWSVVYSLTNRELYFTVYQDWEKVYRLGLP